MNLQASSDKKVTEWDNVQARKVSTWYLSLVGVAFEMHRGDQWFSTGLILLPRGRLAMSGDILVVPTGRKILASVGLGMWLNI